MGRLAGSRRPEELRSVARAQRSLRQSKRCVLSGRISDERRTRFLLERNLLEVFGQRDSARWAEAIAEIYATDCTFYEAEGKIVGRDALNAKIGSILEEAPGFVFSCTAWAGKSRSRPLAGHFGPPGASPVVKGMDVALFGHGRIRALYTFIDKPASK